MIQAELLGMLLMYNDSEENEERTKTANIATSITSSGDRGHNRPSSRLVPSKR